MVAAMRWGILIAILLLAGCESAPQREERKLDMIKRAGATLDEICAQSKKIAAAYLDAGDDDKYQLKKIESATACAQAENENWRLRR